MASSDTTFFTFLVNNKYPNEVEFEITEDFNLGNIVIRCKECNKLGLTWKKHYLPEMVALSKADIIVNIRNQLVEHAKNHNELVKALVEMYSLKHKMMNDEGIIAKAPYPDKEPKAGDWVKDIAKEFELMVNGYYSNIIDPSMGHLPKAPEEKKKAKAATPKESEHRRISLDEGEE